MAGCLLVKLYLRVALGTSEHQQVKLEFVAVKRKVWTDLYSVLSPGNEPEINLLFLQT